MFSKNILRYEPMVFSLASNDPGVYPGSTASSFKVKLASPLEFDGGGDEWLVAVYQATFSAPALELVQIATSVNRLTMVGDETVDDIAVVSTPAAATPNFTWQPYLPVWYPLQTDRYTECEVRLATISGDPLPAGRPTVITLAVRRVGTASR